MPGNWRRAAAGPHALSLPELPGLCGTTGPSATLAARPAPRGVPVGVCVPPTGLPVLLPFPSSMRAAVTTPAEVAGALVARFPANGGLPRILGGSASAIPFSGPARRSLALRPAWSLSRLLRPTTSECFRPCRYLHNPLRLLPAGATVAGRDSHPLGNGAFSRRTKVAEGHPHHPSNNLSGFSQSPIKQSAPSHRAPGRRAAPRG